MAAYRLYYCKEDIRRFNAHHFQATSDAEAIDHAERRIGPLSVPVYELWQGDRLVMRRDGHHSPARDETAIDAMAPPA